MNHPSEEDLIAYQLRESTNEAAIREHVESCAECAQLSDSIAETLRVFSARPVPEPDLDRNWERLRGNLSVLSPAKPRRFRLILWPVAALVTAAVAALLLLSTMRPRPTISPSAGSLAIKSHGPLTTTPTDPQIANHLDTAERLLTEVNHTSGPLDESTRAQAHELLLQNAVYVRTAHEHGDLGEASVLENLGRVLINIDHEPTTPDSGWHLRFELNTDGLLFEIRILRQNRDQL
ncbi:hypothetical protein [Granulicella arctica]|uniref:Zinc-finger domain-containing protein n=1 Tax=Granulicella arctica TaxID=940613 RepID=A0A7Y9TSG4_9BACT|nr:hypothetical protein [Granulicella arctica]NYF78988.1 hypothetical protein [Granulicella arctica]